MTPRPPGRTETCDRNAARVRLAHAGKFLDVAELVAEGDDVPESRSVSAALKPDPQSRPLHQRNGRLLSPVCYVVSVRR